MRHTLTGGGGDGCISGLSYWRICFDKGGLAQGALAPQERVCEHRELSHDRGDGNFGEFAAADTLVVSGFRSGLNRPLRALAHHTAGAATQSDFRSE